MGNVPAGAAAPLFFYYTKRKRCSIDKIVNFRHRKAIFFAIARGRSSVLLGMGEKTALHSAEPCPGSLPGLLRLRSQRGPIHSALFSGRTTRLHRLTKGPSCTAHGLAIVCLCLFELPGECAGPRLPIRIRLLNAAQQQRAVAQEFTHAAADLLGAVPLPAHRSRGAPGS